MGYWLILLYHNIIQTTIGTVGHSRNTVFNNSVDFPISRIPIGMYFLRLRIKDNCFFYFSLCSIVSIVVQNLGKVHFSKVEISENIE